MLWQAALQTESTYCIIHAVAEGFVLGEEAGRSVWGVGELGTMDEVIHRGTSSTSCSNSTTRGVPVRKVKAPLAVVAVALREKRGNTSFERLQLRFSDLFLMHPCYCTDFF